MTVEELKEAIESLIAEENPEVFIVDVKLSIGKKSVLSIKVDTDLGIKLAECAQISRKIGNWLEEENPFDFKYVLEVSSPGVGYPLKLPRQYIQNIGRKLQIHTLSGESYKGTLIKADPQFVEIELGNTKVKNSKKKKSSSQQNNQSGKTQDIQIIKIEMDQIEKAKVIID